MSETTTDIERNAQFLFDYFRTNCATLGCGYCDDESECEDIMDSVESVYVPGFRNLGAGGSRVGFEKDGLVYKIEYLPTLGRKYRWRINVDPNFSEFENYIRLLDAALPHNWRVPVTDIIVSTAVPVIVMEYIDGTMAHYEEFEYTDEHKEVLAVTSLTDIYEGNVIRSGDLFYAIDVAQ